jgi:hypothetical protein
MGKIVSARLLRAGFVLATADYCKKQKKYNGK